MSQLVQTTDLDHDLREIFQLVDRDGGGTSKKTNVSVVPLFFFCFAKKR